MRETSQYELDCICGTYIVTTKPTFQCPKCKRHGEIEWQAKDRAPKADKLRQMPARRSA